MSDCSPLRLAEEGGSTNQSSGSSQESRTMQDGASLVHHHSQQHRRSINLDGPSRRSHRPTDRMNIDTNNENSRRVRTPSESASTKSGQMKYDAKNVIELFIPVSLCMLIVVGTMRITDSYRYSSQTVIWYASVMFTDQTVDTSTRVWQSFANAFIMLIMIVIMTTFLILLYKFRCYKVINVWLILSSLVLLFMFAVMYVAELLKIYNVPLDVYTLMIGIWNFGVAGMISIHWKGPLLLQQGYLILISALLALVFIRSLPDWTTWTVLGIVSIWDLVAVLCPRGPLRILVETAQERNEPIFPALIYSSTVVFEYVLYGVAQIMINTAPSITMTDMNPESSGNASNRSPNRRQNRRLDQDTRASQSTSSNRRRANRNDLTAPPKRSQHPVEIHYEGVAQPPEVDVIQPALSGTSNNWRREPVERTHRIVREDCPSDPADSNDIPKSGAVTQHDIGSNESNIDFHPPQARGSRGHFVQVEEERGVKLGLGDFIFFSLLVGKASSYGNWIITLSCYVAILVGLCLTLSLLAIFRKALPALPISIAFGLCSFFMSYMFATPFAEKLSTNQVFV